MARVDSDGVEVWDSIVIGSGMGGLTTAALLSDLGRKVCVLEQHYTAGGFTHSYERAYSQGPAPSNQEITFNG